MPRDLVPTLKAQPAALGISSGVSAFTTMRPLDFSSTFQRDDPVRATSQRQQLQRRAGARAIQWLDQVHGRRVIQASRQTAQSTPTADAAWTSEPGLGLAIRTADCAPVVLFAKRKDAAAIAAVHCGWRGTVASVIEDTLAALSTPPERISAWIGPTICPNCYEVDAPVRDRLSEPERDAVLIDGRDAQHWWMDLAGLVAHRLRTAGVKNVSQAHLCTSHDDRFFSHRRRGDTGRMATVAWLSG